VAAPVFGRPVAAAAAKLWIVAAGARESIERCQPVFDALARGTSVVGADPWLANAVKLSGNFLIAAALESLGEAFALVRKSGVDAGQFLEIINSALFNSPLYGGYGAAIAKEQFEPAGFKLRLGFKDLRLVQEAAESAAVPMPLAGVLRDRFLAAMARGEGDLDWAAVARIAAVQAGYLLLGMWHGFRVIAIRAGVPRIAKLRISSSRTVRISRARPSRFSALLAGRAHRCRAATVKKPFCSPRPFSGLKTLTPDANAPLTQGAATTTLKAYGSPFHPRAGSSALANCPS
jgi:hypothetical protein